MCDCLKIRGGRTISVTQHMFCILSFYNKKPSIIRWILHKPHAFICWRDSDLLNCNAASPLQYICLNVFNLKFVIV